MHFADLDAVTVDGYGTLLTLVDPVPALSTALADNGVERAPEQVSLAFAAEVAYYRPRAHLGHDPGSLAQLQRECAAVFLRALGSSLDAGVFAPSFVSALRFMLIPGALETLELLRAQRLALAVIANWDSSLPDRLAELGVDKLFATVVTSAEAGAPKPDTAPFLLALDRLGVEPDRALHVGDEPADEAGAHAAGLRFAPAPIARAFNGWR
jgi:putative hydrolase of the HAD superfamily